MTVCMVRDQSDFQAKFDVSRETSKKLAEYESLLIKWNQRINLVAPSTLPNVWHRHFADSAQLWRHRAQNTAAWLDIGSGAGFPALVLALLAQEADAQVRFTLVESDQRKCAFLLNVAQKLDLDLSILAERIENVPIQIFDVISARALAPLEKLLKIAEPFAGNNTICLFPKGNKHESELTEAQKIWHIDASKIPSLTDAEAVLLRVESFSCAR